jgi:uncharacterized protein
MPGGREYILHFVSLGLGEHKYDFNVTDTFFDDFEFSEIKKGNIRIDLTLIKQSSMMALQFEISGSVKMNCDRCTGEFDLPIQGDYKLIVKVGGNDSRDEDDDIITIAANEHELDLKQFIFEYIILSVPIRRIHPDKKGKNGCDKEMLKKLKDYVVEETPEETDPRWDGLKNIKLN